MPEQLLTILKICFLVLLYLFFLRVLRAVWTELRSADVALAGDPGSAVASPVANVVDVPAAEVVAPSAPIPRSVVALAPAEMAGTSWTLHGDMRIGRSDASDIRIDDSFVSTDHARLVFRHVSWMLEDLGSTNGTRLNDVPITGAAVVAIGDRIGVGAAVLEAR